MLEGFYERICKGFCEIVPKKTRQKIFSELTFAGITADFDFWLGKRILASFLVGLIGLLLPLTIGKIFFFSEIYFFGIGLVLVSAIALFAVLCLLMGLLFYLHLYYQIEGRAIFVEDILPDFLLLVASNINAGMTPVSAFRNAARKEFGPLSEEIRTATAKSLGSKNFTESLEELTQKIKSKILTETVSFFSQSLRSGGHLVKLLETSAFDLRQTQEMKKELVSSTKMYAIFVAFIVIIATPILMAVSVQFLKMISAIQAQNPLSAEITGYVAFLSTELRVSPQFMQFSAIALILINSCLSSLFIGLLSTGKAKLGLKNFPILLISSLIVFFITVSFLEQFLKI